MGSRAQKDSSDAATVDWDAYERGELGAHPQVRFRSTEMTAPLVHVEHDHPNCDRSEYVALSYGTETDAGNKAMLLDSNGDLVWSHSERGNIHNVQVQQYKGRDYITFWVGDDDFFGHGHGYFKMYDDTYTLAHVVSVGEDLDGDFHEFTITADDTALVTSYVRTSWDLTAQGREDGYIWDCVFQEIDIDTDQVRFTWRASDHFRFSDMTVNSWQDWTGRIDDPWDWFHLNSVDKDAAGNYLLAARYTNAVSYIDGNSGKVLWNVGGKQGSFREYESGGTAAAFVDPHMARWTETGSALTVFDNVAFWSYREEKRTSHGVKVALDMAKWTAKIDTEFLPSERVFAQAEGSMQLLENGNYFIGFGTTPYFAEFAPNGTLLCSSYYMPPNIDGGVDESRPNLSKAYRVSKHSWSGFPLDSPSLRTHAGDLYVSWNGATEVAAWSIAIKTRGSRYHSWESLGTFAKTGFETRIPFASSEGVYAGLHLTAVDVHGVPFQLWYAEEDGDLVEIWDESVKANESGLSSSLIAFAVLVGVMSVWVKRRTVVALLAGSHAIKDRVQFGDHK